MRTIVTTTTTTTKPVLFILGGPGSGKGTVCSAIAKEYDFQHISTGDVLRAEVARGSDVGKKIAEIQARGTLVPPEVAVTLLKQAMEGSSQRGFLLDGFPRSEEQRAAWHDQLGAPTAVIFLDCTEEEMERRALHRAEMAKQRGEVLRSDDNIEVLRKRFKTNMEQAQPVVEGYKSSLPGRCFVVDANKEPTHVVTQVKHSLHIIRVTPVDS